MRWDKKIRIFFCFVYFNIHFIMENGRLESHTYIHSRCVYPVDFFFVFFFVFLFLLLFLVFLNMYRFQDIVFLTPNWTILDIDQCFLHWKIIDICYYYLFKLLFFFKASNWRVRNSIVKIKYLMMKLCDCVHLKSILHRLKSFTLDMNVLNLN